MNSLIIYLLKSSAILALLVGIYALCMRKETFHQFKRLYLQSAGLLALILPLITFKFSRPAIFTPVNNVPWFEPADVMATEMVTKTPFNWQYWLTALLLIGCVLLFIRMLVGIFYALDIIQKSTKKDLEIGVLAETKKDLSPFSFINYIVMNVNRHKAEEQQTIIAHEQVHISQWHTVDVIIGQIILAIQWVNPAAWLYRHYVMENLEFIADQAVLRNGQNKKDYQLSLVNATLYNNSMVFANHFNKLLIKKRIKMMNKQLSKPSNMLKAVLALPVLLLFIMAFGKVKQELLPFENSNSSTETRQFPIMINNWDFMLAVDKSNQDNLTAVFSSPKFEDWSMSMPSLSNTFDASDVRFLINDWEIDPNSLETLVFDQILSIRASLQNDGTVNIILATPENSSINHGAISSQKSYLIEGEDFTFQVSTIKNDLYEARYESNMGHTYSKKFSHDGPLLPSDLLFRLNGQQMLPEELLRINPNDIKGILIPTANSRHCLIDFKIKTENDSPVLLTNLVDTAIVTEKPYIISSDEHQVIIGKMKNNDYIVAYIGNEDHNYMVTFSSKIQLSPSHFVFSINSSQVQSAEFINTSQNSIRNMNVKKMKPNVYQINFDLKNSNLNTLKRDTLPPPPPPPPPSVGNTGQTWYAPTAKTIAKFSELYDNFILDNNPISKEEFALLKPTDIKAITKILVQLNGSNEYITEVYAYTTESGAPIPPPPPPPPPAPPKNGERPVAPTAPPVAVPYPNISIPTPPPPPPPPPSPMEGLEKAFDQYPNGDYFLNGEKTTIANIKTHLATAHITQLNINGNNGKGVIKIQTKKGKTRDFAEVMPEYPGGINALRNEVQANFKVPKDVTIGGQIVTRFVVEKDGSVGQINILKGLSEESNVAAKKALNGIEHKFTPGLQDGKPVKVWYTLPIVVKLDSSS